LLLENAFITLMPAELCSPWAVVYLSRWLCRSKWLEWNKMCNVWSLLLQVVLV